MQTLEALVKRQCLQYDLKDGSFVKSYDCLDNASSLVKAIKQQACRACLSINKTFKVLYWRYV